MREIMSTVIEAQHLCCTVLLELLLRPSRKGQFRRERMGQEDGVQDVLRITKRYSRSTVEGSGLESTENWSSRSPDKWTNIRHVLFPMYLEGICNYVYFKWQLRV